MKKLFVIALAAIGMVACVQNEIVETPKSDAIAFAGAYIDNATRAAVDPSFTTDQANALDAFNVWGYMDETAGTVFSAEEVEKQNGAWSYNNTQYWAPGHTYYFAALAPMENKHWSVALAGDPEAQMGLGTVTFENVDGGEDLIYAKAKVTTPGMSELLQNGMDPVKLQFNHLLSKVKFTFINGFTTENAFVSVSDIKMTVAKDATINLATDAPVWEGLANEKVLEFGNVAKLAMSEDDECTDERLTIPATDAYIYDIQFEVVVYMGTVEAYRVTKTSTITGQAFEMGKAYNLVAEITPDNLNLLPIEFEVVVNEWETPYVDVDVDTYYDAASNTYHVATAAGLHTVAEGINNGEIAKNVNIVLTQDIDLSEVANLSRAGENNWTPIGLGTNLSAGDTFRGTFDGQGHTIKNMVCNRADVAGLFGYVYAATIKNVTIENATINSNHYAGGIVAWVLNNRGNIQVPMIIENCHVKNSTITSTPEQVNGEWDNGDKVGGIVGFAHFADATGNHPGLNEGAGIFGCSVENTTIKAYRDFAGIAGYALYAPINNCTVKGVNLVWDNTNNYKNYDAAPATIGEIIGRNEGYNTVDGNEYVANGVTVDADGNYHILAAGGLKWVSSQVNTMEFYVNQAANIFDGKTVYIENDINLGGAEWTPIGDYAFSRTSFNGVFDGQGHTISNFKVTNAVAWTEKVTEASYGFFGNVKGTIKNVTVKNATVKPEGGRYSAALVGRLHNGGVIENCHVVNSSVEINHWQVGGLVGQNNNGNIYNCSVVGSTITGKAAVGAIVGMDMTAGEHVIEGCRVANTALVQNASFGASYDASYGLAVGLANASGIVLHINDMVVENNTIKGAASNVLVGDIETGATILIDGLLPVASGLGLNADGAYVVTTGEGFKTVATEILNDGTKNVTVELANDIDLAGIEWPAVCTKAAFVLDGKGYAIKNLTTSAVEDHGFYSTAMFTSTRKATTIKNLVVENATVTGKGGDNSHGAVLVACNYAALTIEGVTVKNSTISNCDRTGGLVTYLYFTTATVENCKVEGCTINSIGTAGAILGMNNSHNFTMKGCEVKNTTVSSSEGKNKAGIFIGTWQDAGTLTNEGNTHSGSKAINAGAETNNEIGRHV